MKTLKKLPVVLALIVTILAVACSEIDVNPRTEDDDNDPIVIKPVPKSTSAPDDTVAIVG